MAARLFFLRRSDLSTYPFAVPAWKNVNKFYVLLVGLVYTRVSPPWGQLSDTDGFVKSGMYHTNGADGMAQVIMQMAGFHHVVTRIIPDSSW